MSDSVRMMDLAAVTRGLEEFRRIDPEQRVLSHRMATQAAVKHMEEVAKDVPESERSTPLHVRDRREDRKGGRSPRRPPAEGAEEADAEPVPEQNEGHLLDVRA